MLRTTNSAAMRAIVAVMNALLAFCAFFVLNLGFTSCDTGIDDVVVNQKPCETGDCDDPDNPNTDPEAKVEDVDKLTCNFGKVTWTAENATLTKAASEYVYANRDGGVFGNQGVDYIYSVVYNLPEYNHDDQKSYTLNNAVAAFNYKTTRYLAKDGDAIFANEPQIKKDGNVTVLTWGEKEYVAFLATSISSVSSLTIEGIEKRDLCTNGISYTYEGFELIDNGSDDEYYLKTLRIYGKAEVTDASEGATQKFYIDKTYYVAKQGGITPPTPGEKEPIKYDITNKDETTEGVTGDLVVTYDDGSKETLGEINIRLNRSTFNNAEQTIKVNDFSYSKLEPSYANNLATGNVRSDSQLGCQISITEYKNTITMRTSKATCVMGGIWEYPVIVDPLGGEHAWDLTGWELSESSISDDGGNGNRMVLTYTANASYLSANETIKSIVNLVKEDGGDETQQTGAYAKDQRIEGKYIKWTLVRTYNNTNESETPMMIAHLGNVETEARKATQDRSYAATTPEMILKSQENFTDGNYSGTLSTYTSTFSYPDFTNVVTSQARNVVNYNDNGFEVKVWNENLLLQKSGVDKGTTNISSNASYKKYLDKINYSLKNGGTECATGIQEVEYSEETNPIDPTPDPEYTYLVEKDKIEGTMLYFFKITKNKDNGEIISKNRDSQSLVFSLNATAAADWSIKEGEAAGMTLTSSSFNYSSAKDYVFGSNRGDNKAAVSLQTEYKVTFGDQEFTLSVDGEVKGEVAKTSSTSTSNTYTFTASLYVDGVKVASDSDQAVETINKGEEDKITRSVEKIGVSGGMLNYYYIVKHSVQTNLDSRTQHSVPVEASATATACADWTIMSGEVTGLTLSATSFSYVGNQDYVFGSNRGNNIVNAYLKEKYVVTHDGQDFELSVTGSVTGSVSKNGNNYTFTGKVLADGVEVASASDIAVETVKELDYIQIVSVESTLAATTTPGVYTPVFVAHYEDGLSVSSTGATSTNSQVNSMAGNQLVVLQLSGNTWSWGGLVNVSMQKFTYEGMNSPILTVTATTVNSDGSYSVANNLGNTYTFPKRSK